MGGVSSCVRGSSHRSESLPSDDRREAQHSELHVQQLPGRPFEHQSDKQEVQQQVHDAQPKQQRTSSSGIDKDTAMLPASVSTSTSPFAGSAASPFANGYQDAEHHLNRASSPNMRLQHEYRGTMHSHDEIARISTLQSLDILDTEPTPKYDDITKLLCSIFNVPIAQLSLVDSDRQWCKSVQGLDVKQINRDIAFCAWVLLPKHPTALVVEDTFEDARFRDNPLVTGPPYIRFYAGAPLIASNGHRLGSLCVVDLKPRQLDTEQLALLCNFAEMAVREMEKDKLSGLQRGNSLAEEMTGHGMHRAVKALTHGLLVVDVRSLGWPVLFMNDQGADYVGTDRNTAQGNSMWGFFKAPQQINGNMPVSHAALYQRPVQECREFSAVACTMHGVKLSLTFRPASSDVMDEHMLTVGIPNFVEFMRRKEKSLYFCFITTVEHGPMPNASPAGTTQVEAPGAKDVTPFPGVRLGPLVGKGSFGKVYRGIWNNDVVAIKVIEHFEQMHPIQENASPRTPHYPQQRRQEALQQGLNGEQPLPEASESALHQFQQAGEFSPLLEAVLGHGLKHPNIVQTYQYATQATKDREVPGSQFNLQRASLQAPMTKHGYTPFHSDTTAGGSKGSRAPLRRNSKERERQITETWLLLEYCDSGSLQEGIEQGWFRKPQTLAILAGAPDLDGILRTAIEIVDALCYLHKANVLHGDLTGNNILLASSEADDRRFTVKIADFGLSRHASASTVDTETYGTVTHMPPELLMDGKLTKSADVYAFGVLLWEMYTGEKPFAGMRHAQIIYHVTTLLKHPEFPPNTPPGLKELGDRCMHADKDQRLSFQQLLPQLQQLHQQLVLQDPASPHGNSDSAALDGRTVIQAVQDSKAG